MSLHTILTLPEAVPVPEAITLALAPLVAVAFWQAPTGEQR